MKGDPSEMPDLAFPCLAYQQLLCIEGILIWL